MPASVERRKRKSDRSEISELREKLRKLEERQSSRFRRIRVISSSSESRSPSPARVSPRPRPTASGSGSVRSSRPRQRKRDRRRRTSSSSAVSPAQSRSNEQGAHSDSQSSSDSVEILPGNPQVVQAQVHAPPNEQTINIPTPQIKNTEPAIIQTSTEPQTNEEIIEPELDRALLELLGEDPSVQKTFGKDIQRDLAIRFNHIATNGLTREQRKELREKYPVPANCTLIDAPQVNPEVKAAISETISKRLNAMEQKQKQLASAISGLSEAVSLLMSKNDTDPNLLKILIDSGRLICDSQYSDSLTRRYLILAGLKKEMKDQLLQTQIDTFLFGKNLSDTLKSAKAINKSGEDLRPKPPTKPQTSWRSNNQKTTNSFKRNNLNQKTHPSSHRSTGSTRYRAPAPKNQPGSSSRNSQQTHKRGNR